MKLFVTGTDTGVGKTFVCAAIARELVRQRQSVFAWKPVETGCREVNGRLVGDDAETLAIAAGDWQTDVERGMYLFRNPVAPLVAATQEARSIDVPRIVSMALAATSEHVLVEGAGGIRVPLTVDVDMAGLATACGFPVLIVARASLGTINHSVLTVEAAQRDGLRVVGVALSRLPGVDLESAETNRAEIERICHVPVHIFDGRDSSGLLTFLGYSSHLLRV
ncbi:MAG: dethiobiotin synthase [Kofleriaceae bacterium]|nr:dethiobiotin synthase [Kofleriaceae bacterium]